MKIASYTRSDLKPIEHPSKVAPASGMHVHDDKHVSAAVPPVSGLESKDSCLASYTDYIGEVVGLAIVTEDVAPSSSTHPASGVASKHWYESKVSNKHELDNGSDEHVHDEIHGYTVAGLTVGGVLVDISHVAHMTVASDNPNLVNCSVDGMMFDVHVNPTLTDPVTAEVMVTANVYWTDPELSMRSALGSVTKIGVPVTINVHSKVVDISLVAGMPRDVS